MKMKELIIISVFFYVGWFGCILLAPTQFSEASLVFPLILISFLFFRKTLKPKNISLALIIAAIGIFLDSYLLSSDFISTPNESVGPLPIWLGSIWLLFSFSIIVIGPNFSLPIWLAGLLGMVMGPLSYKSGEVLHILEFSDSRTPFVYAIFWALAFPLILQLSKRLA